MRVLLLCHVVSEQHAEETPRLWKPGAGVLEMTALLDLLQVRFVDRYGSVRFGVRTN